MNSERTGLGAETGRVFPRRQSLMTSAGLWFAGGVGLFVLAAMGFALAVLVSADQLTLHSMSTVPAIFGVGTLAWAWALSRAPSQVCVDDSGVTIETRRGSQHVGWQQIGWATVGNGTLHNRRVLLLYDGAGKRVAAIDAVLEGFDELVELVIERVDAEGDEQTDYIRMKKARRSAVFMAASAVALMALAGGCAWMTYEEQRGRRLLDENGVPGTAEIVRRFVAPDGRTTRLVYRVTTSEGLSAERNVEVWPQVWEALDGMQEVSVVYVPTEPKWSRLAAGEVPDTDLTRRPTVMYLLSGALALLCAVFLVGAALAWRGWDIDMDSKTGKISIKRYGTGR